jgi:hypothetical protein
MLRFEDSHIAKFVLYAYAIYKRHYYMGGISAHKLKEARLIWKAESSVWKWFSNPSRAMLTVIDGGTLYIYKSKSK